MSRQTIEAVVCWAIGHWPALVTTPTRCRRCRHMIEWDHRGTWRRAL